MKLCLVWPKSSWIHNQDAAKDPHLAELMNHFYSIKEKKPGPKLFPSIGAALPLIAALTPPVFEEIRIVDGTTQEIPFDEPFDIVGISMMTAQSDEGYRICREFKKRGVHTVIGGIHPTLEPSESMMHADTVICGEAENTWLAFIDDFLQGRPKQLYRQKKMINLKGSPVPRYDLMSPYNNTLYAFIQTSRGCPNNCRYCSVVKANGATFRYKSVEQIINEINTLRQLNPSTNIFFSDDNMFVNRNRLRKLLTGVSELNIGFAAQADIGVSKDEEMLELLSASGCQYLFIGLESVTEPGIASLSKWKQRHFHEYQRSILQIKSYGIDVCGAFIVGTDDHDETIFPKIIDFAEQTSITNIHAGILTPFPGTPIRQSFVDAQRLLPKPWSNYDLFGMNFMPKSTTPYVLQKGLLELMLHFSEKTAKSSDQFDGKPARRQEYI